MCRRPNQPNELYNGLGQVVYLAVSLFKGSFNFLYRAAAVQTQLFGREAWGKHGIASSYRERVWMKG